MIRGTNVGLSCLPQPYLGIGVNKVQGFYSQVITNCIYVPAKRGYPHVTLLHIIQEMQEAFLDYFIKSRFSFVVGKYSIRNPGRGMGGKNSKFNFNHNWEAYYV